MLCDSTAGGLMSKLLPVQRSSAACWNRKAKPTVSRTWRSGSKPSCRRKTRSIASPSERDGERRDRDREQPRAGGPDHRQRDIAAQHEVGAVRQIDDPHHAENQRQAAAHQEQQRAIGDAVEGLDQPEIQVHYAATPRRWKPEDWAQAYMRLGGRTARSIAAGASDGEIGQPVRRADRRSSARLAALDLAPWPPARRRPRRCRPRRGRF